MFRRKARKSNTTAQEAAAAAAAEEEVLEAFDYQVDTTLHNTSTFVEMIEIGDEYETGFTPTAAAAEAAAAAAVEPRESPAVAATPASASQRPTPTGSGTLPPKKKRSKSKKKKKKKHKKKGKKSGSSTKPKTKGITNGETTDDNQAYDTDVDNDDNDDQDDWEKTGPNDEEILQLLTAANNYLSDDSLDRMVETRGQYSRYTAVDDDDFQQLPPIAGDDRYTANPSFSMDKGDPKNPNKHHQRSLGASMMMMMTDLDDNSEPAQWRSWDNEEEEAAATAAQQQEEPEAPQSIPKLADTAAASGGNVSVAGTENVSVPYVLEGAISLGAMSGEQQQQQGEPDPGEDADAEEEENDENENPSLPLLGTAASRQSQQPPQQQQSRGTEDDPPPFSQALSSSLPHNASAVSSKRGGGGGRGKYGQMIKDEKKRRKSSVASNSSNIMNSRSNVGSSSNIINTRSSLVKDASLVSSAKQSQDKDGAKPTQSKEEEAAAAAAPGEEDDKVQELPSMMDHSSVPVLQAVGSETSSLTDPMAAPKPSQNLSQARSVPPRIVETTNRRPRTTTTTVTSGGEEGGTTTQDGSYPESYTHKTRSSAVASPEVSRTEDIPPATTTKEVPVSSQQQPLPDTTTNNKPPRSTSVSRGRSSSKKMNRRSGRQSSKIPPIRMSMSPVVLGGDVSPRADTEEGHDENETGQHRWFSGFGTKSRENTAAPAAATAVVAATAVAATAMATKNNADTAEPRETKKRSSTGKHQRRQSLGRNVSASSSNIGRSKSRDRSLSRKKGSSFPSSAGTTEDADQHTANQSRLGSASSSSRHYRQTTNTLSDDQDAYAGRGIGMQTSSFPQSDQGGEGTMPREQRQRDMATSFSARDSMTEDRYYGGSPENGGTVRAVFSEMSVKPDMTADAGSAAPTMKNASCQTSLASNEEEEDEVKINKRSNSTSKQKSTSTKQKSRRPFKSAGQGLQVLSPLAIAGAARQARKSRGSKNKKQQQQQAQDEEDALHTNSEQRGIEENNTSRGVSNTTTEADEPQEFVESENHDETNEQQEGSFDRNVGYSEDNDQQDNQMDDDEEEGDEPQAKTPSQLSQADVKMMYGKSLVSGTEDSMNSQAQKSDDDDLTEDDFLESNRSYSKNNSQVQKQVEAHLPTELDEFAGANNNAVAIPDEPPLVQCLKFYNLASAAAVAGVLISATDCRGPRPVTNDAHGNHKNANSMRAMGSRDEIETHRDQYNSTSPKVEVMLSDDPGSDPSNTNNNNTMTEGQSRGFVGNNHNMMGNLREAVSEDVTEEAPDIGRAKSYVKEITGMRFHLDEDWEAKKQEAAIKRAQRKAAEHAVSITTIEIPTSTVKASNTSDTSSSDSRDPAEEGQVDSNNNEEGDKCNTTEENATDTNAEASKAEEEAQQKGSTKRKERRGIFSVFGRRKGRRSVEPKNGGGTGEVAAAAE